MAEESDILIEVEAAESVYGDDCVVVTKYPPHLNLFIKPRTAEVSSQQVFLLFYKDLKQFGFLILVYISDYDYDYLIGL